MSAPAGSAGNYAATPTQPSNQWSQGGATGGFSYSYPVSVPPALGGSAPDVTLAYSSQMVDGMTASTNTQSSWIGSGWDYQPGYIERAYQSCSDDGISGSGDSCWAYGGAEVTLDQAGMGGALVTDDSGHAWHLADDNGATIKLVTNSGATGNGAYNGEYWVITTQDGTRFYYGAGHLPSAEGGTGADPATHPPSPNRSTARRAPTPVTAPAPARPRTRRTWPTAGTSTTWSIRTATPRCTPTHPRPTTTPGPRRTR